MTEIQYLLGKIAEEASEVAQMAIKCANFGLHETRTIDDPTNFSRLAEELDDLQFMCDKLEEAMDRAGIDTTVDLPEKDREARFLKYKQYCVDLGTLCLL